ncbi:MAG: hypothetical protein IJU23_03350 [Proteobacteria bacterium]|nr:hypothetical protein [Pseudomonadota bacterium]
MSDSDLMCENDQKQVCSKEFEAKVVPEASDADETGLPYRSGMNTIRQRP